MDACHCGKSLSVRTTESGTCQAGPCRTSVRSRRCPALGRSNSGATASPAAAGSRGRCAARPVWELYVLWRPGKYPVDVWATSRESPFASLHSLASQAASSGVFRFSRSSKPFLDLGKFRSSQVHFCFPFKFCCMRQEERRTIVRASLLLVIRPV